MYRYKKLNKGRIKILKSFIECGQQAEETGITGSYLGDHFSISPNSVYDDLNFLTEHGLLKSVATPPNCKEGNYFRITLAGKFVALRESLLKTQDLRELNKIIDTLVPNIPGINRHWNDSLARLGPFRYTCFFNAVKFVSYSIKAQRVEASAIFLDVALPSATDMTLFHLENYYFTYKETSDYRELSDIDYLKQDFPYIPNETRTTENVRKWNSNSVRQLEEDLVSFIEYAYYYYAYCFIDATCHILKNIRAPQKFPDGTLGYLDPHGVKNKILQIAKDCSKQFSLIPGDNWIRNPDEYIIQVTKQARQLLDVIQPESLAKTAEKLSRTRTNTLEIMKAKRKSS